MKKDLSVKHVFIMAWKTFREETWFFIGITIVYVLISMVPSVLDLIEKNMPQITDDPIFSILNVCISIAVFILGFILPIGYTYIMLQAVDHGSFTFRDLFSTKGVFWKFLFAEILAAIVVGIGFILLIIPGIFLAITLMFAPYIVIDEHLSPAEALKRSYDLTKGVRWKLVLFILVIMGINILGAIVLGIGFLITMPISVLASVHVYRSLKHQNAEIIEKPLPQPEPAL